MKSRLSNAPLPIECLLRLLPRDGQRVCLRSRTGVRAPFMTLTLARGSRALLHSMASEAFHGAFMALPPYTRSKEDEGQELGRGVSNGSHPAGSRPDSATRESIEWECPATSARSDSSLRIPWDLGAPSFWGLSRSLARIKARGKALFRWNPAPVCSGTGLHLKGRGKIMQHFKPSSPQRPSWWRIYDFLGRPNKP